MSFAHCTPDHPWKDATEAGIRPLDGGFDDVIVPVEHRSPGTHTIQRADYPDGILVIPTGNDPTAMPAVLPALVSAGSSQAITLEPSNLLDTGLGGAVIFV